MDNTTSKYEELLGDVSHGPSCTPNTTDATVTSDTADTPTQVDVKNDLSVLVPAAAEGQNSTVSHKKLNIMEIPARKKVIFFLLCVAYFTSGCGMSLPAPFFPIEAKNKGVSPTIMGLVFGCYQLVNFLSSPIFGQFLAEIGPKIMCTTGIFVAGTSSLVFGFLYKVDDTSVFVALAFVFRITEALGFSAFVTACFAILCCEFENKVASVFAMLESCVGIGLMVGPTIGGALYQAGGFGLPFWVVGAIIIVNGLVICTFMPPAEKDVTDGRKGNVLTLLRSPLIWVALMLLLISAVALSFLDPTLALHMAQFNLTPLEIGLYFIIVPVCHAITAPLWGYLIDRTNVEALLMMAVCVTCALGMLMIGPTPLLPFLPRELGFKEGLSTFGLVAGLFNAIFFLGAFIGPTIGGVLQQRIGFEYASTLLAFIFIFYLFVQIIFFSFRRASKRRKLASEESNIHPQKPF